MLPLLLSSCFGRYVVTDKEVRRHYAKADIKPQIHLIKNDSLTLCVASIGADTLPMLLLIHGAPGSQWGYMNMMDDTILNKKYHIVSVDRLGYGKSRLNKSRLKNKRKFVTSIDGQAKALLPIFSLNHSSEKITILGRSYGAPIAAKLATLAPDKVKDLIMVSPVIDPDKEKFYWFSKWGRMTMVQWFLPESFNAATAEKYTHSDELRKIMPMWGELNVPTTVIQGGNDWIADPSNFEFAKAHIKSKHAQYIFLYNAGHMITFSHKEMIREMLLRNLSVKDRVSTISLGSTMGSR